MAYLTANSTDADVKAAYDNNASYDVEGSVEKARYFIQAVRLLIRRRPTAVTGPGGSGDLTLESLKDQENEAKRWLAAHDTTGTSAVGGAGYVTRADLRGFR